MTIGTRTALACRPRGAGNVDSKTALPSISKTRRWATSGALAPHLNLKVTRGSFPSGAASISCDGFEADASTETLALTTLGALPAGAAVNLERAMRPDDRLGGHLVSGHVDGMGTVESVTDDARAQRWRFTTPRALMRYIASKGSVCVDGTSLTVNAIDADGFDVALVPHTVAHTAFATTRPGDPVNLEVDQVARYVERLLEHKGTP